MTDHTIHCRRDGDGSKETNGLGRGAQKNTSTAISQHESAGQKKRGQKSLYTIQCNRDSMKRACPFMQHHKSKTARVSNIFQGRTRILCISRKLQPQRLAMPIALSHPYQPGSRTHLILGFTRSLSASPYWGMGPYQSLAGSRHYRDPE